MKTIGIVGGVGPQAGVDLHQKIIRLTEVSKDQEHLRVIHISFSADIADRSEYLLSPSTCPNPAEAVYRVIECLHKGGAQVIGIPCNTCHVSSIFSKIQQNINHYLGAEVQLLHMINEVCSAAASYNLQKFGLLATQGTYNSQLYSDIFEQHGLKILQPTSKARQGRVHNAIYDPKFGIKANAGQSEFARKTLLEEAQHLLEEGAEAIIMGCTEIPLVLQKSDFLVPTLDTTEILAQSLIEHASSSK